MAFAALAAAVRTALPAADRAAILLLELQLLLVKLLLLQLLLLLAELLLMLLSEVLSLQLGLHLLLGLAAGAAVAVVIAAWCHCYWERTGSGVFSSPPKPPACASAVFASAHWLKLAEPCVRAENIYRRGLSACFLACIKNQSDDAVLVLRQEARVGCPTKLVSFRYN